MAETYQEALMRRLSMIDELGTNATSLLQDRLARQRAATDRFAGMPSPNFGAAGGAMPNVGGSFGKFLRAITGQESGGNYRAVNGQTGAMGFAQVLPSNINGRHTGWDYEALGRDISPSQFLASPQIQQQIVQYKLRQYYAKYGPAGAAVAWYAGPGTADSYMRAGGVGFGRPQADYPSIAAYVQQVLARMR